MIWWRLKKDNETNASDQSNNLKENKMNKIKLYFLILLGNCNNYTSKHRNSGQ
jgi:hypothetical protein